MLQELITSYSRFKGSKDLDGRGKMVAWWVLPSLLGVIQSLGSCRLPTPSYPFLYILISFQVDTAEWNESLG